MPESATRTPPAPLRPAVAERTGHWRAKRIFLWTVIASLAACTAIAVGVLLLGEFDDTTARVLGTLGSVAYHSAVALACMIGLERRRWPALSVAGLVLFAGSFVLLTACIWWPGLGEERLVRAVLSTLALSGYYVLAIPAAALRERRPANWLAPAGLGACVLGLLLLLVVIWAESSENVAFAKTTAIVAIIAFSLAQTSLLIFIPRGRGLDWLLFATLGCIWLLAGWAALMIALELDDEFYFRVLGALGVLDACGCLALVVLVKLRQVQKVEQLASTAARVALRCPRCGQEQVLPAGASRCASCGLKFRIEIEEPRCARCDYLLWQLTERRCPECGTPF